jgi:hypothetical protein
MRFQYVIPWGTDYVLHTEMTNNTVKHASNQTYLKKPAIIFVSNKVSSNAIHAGTASHTRGWMP